MDAHSGRLDVVVGVDGSDLSLHAVGWAAAEARLRDLPLRIVHAERHPTDAPGEGPRVAEVLARAFAVARRAEPDVEVSTTHAPMDPHTSLLDAAADAALLVVGMGGGDAPGEVLARSIALDVSGRAPCPVVVVRGGPVAPRGPVLVGVDTIDADADALTFAFADARRHGGRVAVLHARYGSEARGGAGAEQAGDVIARDRLLADLEPWTTRFADVPVEVTVVHGNPVLALLAAAQGCRSVVLGSRGHGPYERALFGSTSHEILRRSAVPVTVVDPAVVPVSTNVGQLDRPHDGAVLI